MMLKLRTIPAAQPSSCVGDYLLTQQNRYFQRLVNYFSLLGQCRNFSDSSFGTTKMILLIKSYLGVQRV